MPGEHVNAFPSKRFFVEMLTKDIELSDAILDLLDNCVDGVVRSRAADNGRQLTKGKRYWAKLTIGPDCFTIEDNCGGIPLSVARDYAFRFGREATDTRDNNLHTIGMYGIGMKRAVFKLGRQCKITSRNGADSYQVEILPNWNTSPDWHFPLREAGDPLGEAGTRVEISDLHPGVSQTFRSTSFTSDLRKAVWQHYSDFLAADFVVEINGDGIPPNPLRFLYDAAGAKPFYFSGTWQGVGVEMAVGLNAPPSSREEEEEEEEGFGGERQLDHAGWTVLCNGRPVLYGDKTRLTCWGDGAPSFHPQFAVISGAVEFTAADASSLPITTTKRGVDMSSELYLLTRVIMREGMLIFTRHTNRWKNYKRQEQENHYAGAEFLGLRDLFNRMRQLELKDRKDLFPGGRVFNPEKGQPPLPKPEGGADKRRRIVFSRPDAQVKRLAKFLFDDEGTAPASVGEACFDRVAEQAGDRS